MRYLVIGLMTLINLLSANIDPVAVSNVKKLKHQHVIMPLPQEQLVQADPTEGGAYRFSAKEPLLLLLKPFEKLYLQHSESNLSELTLETSLDGRLFVEGRYAIQPDGNMTLSNPFKTLLAVRITAEHENAVRVYTSFDDSLLNDLDTTQLALPGEKVSLYTRSQRHKDIYYAFGREKKFSLPIKGPGTLRLSMRTPVDALDALGKHRQRILVKYAGKERILESNSAVSMDYTDEEKRQYLSYAAAHYIPLSEGENNITLHTYDEILLQGELLHQNIINPLNKGNIAWDVGEKAFKVNQPRWKNSNADDGMKRMDSLWSAASSLHDSRQRSDLFESARAGTVMKRLYPTKIPDKGRLLHADYGSYRLYLEAERAERNRIPEAFDLTALNALDRGTFVEVPEEVPVEREPSYLELLEKFYFRTRQYRLDRKLARQVEQILPRISASKEIHVFGYTDSTGDKQMNDKLSLQRCESIRDAMIQGGVPAEDIQLYPMGEKGQSVPTADGTKEISNRRVEVKIRNKVEKNRWLEYHFPQPLEQETRIEVTVLKKGEKTALIYADVDGRHRAILRYGSEEPYENYALSQALTAVQKLDAQEERKAEQTLSYLRGTSVLPLLKETGSMTLILPKGSRYIRISRAKETDEVHVALSQQSSTLYRDSDYALGKEYSGTYRRFAASLQQSLPVEADFDPWYEHTHPLRQWMLLRLQEAEVNLNCDEVPGEEQLMYAYHLAESDGEATALQIAKHTLLLSMDSGLRQRAYRLLLSLSKEPEEKLVWQVVYFAKTASPTALKAISEGLQEAGNSALALDAIILLEQNEEYRQRAYTLAMDMNNPRLAGFFTDRTVDPEAFLLEKRDVLEAFRHQGVLNTYELHVSGASGMALLSTKTGTPMMRRYRATMEQPVTIDVEGPVELHLDVRRMHPVESHGWMSVEADGIPYHFPLVKTEMSDSLKVLPERTGVSHKNSLKLRLDKGHHRLKLHGYKDPLLIGLWAKAADKEPIRALDQQLLRTSDFDPDIWVRAEAKPSLVYSTALLWNYTHATYQHRYHAQAQAIMFEDGVQDPYIRSILSTIRQYSSFSPVAFLETPAGFSELKIPRWSPQSKIQQQRTPLIEGIENYDVIMTGADRRVINIQGGQHLSVELTQLRPLYLPVSPLSFAVSLDGEKEEMVSLNGPKQRWKKEFSLRPGEHSLKVRLVDPLSTHYLGMNVIDDAKGIDPTVRQRYFITTQDTPVTVHEEGPKLLRIDEMGLDEVVHKRYLYLPEQRQYHHKILPTGGNKESLVRVYELQFDPLKKAPKIVRNLPNIRPLASWHVPEPIVLGEDDLDVPSLQSHELTCSLELAIRNEELSSDDDPDSRAERVAELGEYCRKRVSRDLYLRQHYFTRLYANPLLALTHKGYFKVPMENTWGILELNAYMQESNYRFKNLNVKGELFIKEPLFPQWRHIYGAGAFKHFMDYGTPGKEALDPLVYSRYKRDHQHGGYLWYELYYRPFDDMEFGVESKVTSNEDFGITDNVRIKPMIRHLAYPFYTSVYLDSRRYFEDRDRPNAYNVNRFGAKLRYDTFFETNRLQLQGEVVHKIENADTQFTLQLIWHFSDDRRRYNFMPDEKLFDNLWLRLEEER